jgi:hypothetical protein
MDAMRADGGGFGLSSGRYLKKKSGIYLMVQMNGLGTLLCGRIVTKGIFKAFFRCFVALSQPLRYVSRIAPSPRVLI